MSCSSAAGEIGDDGEELLYDGAERVEDGSHLCRTCAYDAMLEQQSRVLWAAHLSDALKDLDGRVVEEIFAAQKTS